MRTYILSLCAALAFGGSAFAQDLARATGNLSSTDNNFTQCLMRSTTSTWQKLGLTDEKSKEAQAIADRCVREHKMNAGGTGGEAVKDGMTETHVQELKTLLTTEEFTKWKNWCGKQETPMEGSKGNKSEPKQ